MKCPYCGKEVEPGSQCPHKELDKQEPKKSSKEEGDKKHGSN